ncbi:MAG: hypothetical protein ACF8Q5_10400 [Phycisphaerales bacterium JB040]
MMILLGLYLFTLAGFVALLMVWQHASGRHEILSLRNIALVGLILFQITSVGLRMINENYDYFRLQDPGAAGLEFAAFVTIFFIVFALSYRWGPLAGKVAARVPRVPETNNPMALIGLAILLTLLAVPLRFAVNVPVLGVVADFLGVATAAMACGLLGWVWAPRLLNPAYAGIALFFVAANLVTVMTGSFGRRSIVAVFGCMVWGMYFAHWRYLPTRTLLTRLALLSAGPLLFVALYTSVRSAAEHDRSAGDHISAMQTTGSVATGVAKLIDGQATGPASLWLIENYPESYEPRHLFTLRYFFALNVPRMLWPGKPEPQSVLIADQANIQRVQQDRIKLSCGIVGVAAAEGGWYAIIVYGLCLGVFVRVFDEIVRHQPTTPFIVLPVGAALGQILGLARGDTSTFANTYFITTLGALAIMIPVGRFMARFNADAIAGYDGYDDYTEDGVGPGHDDPEGWRAEGSPDYAA